MLRVIGFCVDFRSLGLFLEEFWEIVSAFEISSGDALLSLEEIVPEFPPPLAVELF